jgi:hypothetical protein
MVGFIVSYVRYALSALCAVAFGLSARLVDRP